MKFLPRLSFLLALTLLFTGTVFGMTPEEKGLSLSQKADTVNSGYKGEYSDMKMVLINAHGDRVERKMTSKRMEVSNDGDKSMVMFLWPADVKGTRMLTWSHKTGSDDQWLYLPALKRIKRISSRNQSGAFMGSEFSYEDFSAQEVEKFTYKYIKDETIENRDTWVIERYPIDKKSGYTKQVVWMDKEYYNPIKIDYYDRRGDLLKTATFSGYQKYGPRWLQEKISIVNHQTQKSSILSWQNRKTGLNFKARDFHKNSLKR